MGVSAAEKSCHSLDQAAIQRVWQDAFLGQVSLIDSFDNSFYQWVVSLPVFSLGSWAETHQYPFSWYWKSPNNDPIRYALGECASITQTTQDLQSTMAEAEAWLSQSDKDLTIISAISFPEIITHNASSLLEYHAQCIVPVFEFRQYSSHVDCIVTLSQSLKSRVNQPLSEFISQEWQKLWQQSEKLMNSRPRVGSVSWSCHHSEWMSMCDTAHQRISGSDLEKVVLSRRMSCSLNHSIHPMTLLNDLTDTLSNVYSIAFSQHNSTFISTTPETLYKRNKHQLKSVALAGTVPRGSTSNDDRLLALQLINQPKLISEHSKVHSMIQSAFTNLCSSYEESSVDVLKMTHVQHLISHFEGALKPSMTDSDIIPRLHPTPAVSGHPLPQSLECIQKLETYSRGLYAGALGIMSRDYSEFVVGLRSATFKDGTLDLYSGVGIVPGSDPDMEWEELNLKLLPYLEWLNYP